MINDKEQEAVDEQLNQISEHLNKEECDDKTFEKVCSLMLEKYKEAFKELS